MRRLQKSLQVLFALIVIGTSSVGTTPLLAASARADLHENGGMICLLYTHAGCMFWW